MTCEHELTSTLKPRRLRFVLDTSNLVLSGLLAIVMGSIVCALLLIPILLWSDGTWEWAAVLLMIIPSVMTMAIFGVIILAALLVILMGPMRFIWKRCPSVFWMTVSCGMLGVFIGTLPWLTGALYRTLTKRQAFVATATGDGIWVMPLVYCMTGLVFCALFGFWYARLEQRSKLIPATVQPDPDAERVIGKNINVTNWLLLGGLLIFGFLIVWYFTTPLRMVAAARRTAIANQEGVLMEARQMLEQSKSEPNGAVYLDAYRDDPNLPPNLAKLGDVSAGTSARFPGAVKVGVTGGFTHMGLFVIPDPTSSTLTVLKEHIVSGGGSLTVINEHVYEYSEGH